MFKNPTSFVENLLKNPNFEPKFWNPDSTTQEFKSDPWHIDETGGHGWRLEKTPLGKIFFMK